MNHGKIPNVPSLTQGKPYSAAIFWPTPKSAGEKFPVLTFAHGTGVGGPFADVTTGYMTILPMVVSKGFVAVAPESCPTLECASPFAHDQLATPDAVRKDISLHPALKMGAMASIAAGGGTMAKTYRPADHNIKAVARTTAISPLKGLASS